ncbi:MAG: GNAT family N-acetyltransferase [Verrucomicrobiae bacterium]|nr:GNAT family N-acetyltransferase [Verrucomicrobiae bacterium]
MGISTARVAETSNRGKRRKIVAREFDSPEIRGWLSGEFERALVEPPEHQHQIQVGDVPVTIRTIRPADRDIGIDFVRRLSPAAKYLRYHHAIEELETDTLDRFLSPDYPDEMALIAIVPDNTLPGGIRQIGVARYARGTNPEDAEIAIAVADDWQGRGVGRQMLLDLREFALGVGIRHLVAKVLPQNAQMMKLARKLGFQHETADPDEGTVALGKGLPKE